MTQLPIEDSRMVNPGRELEGDRRVRGDRIERIGGGLAGDGRQPMGAAEGRRRAFAR